jgi:competence ComEA-like helix-hairpin-helix protein
VSMFKKITRRLAPLAALAAIVAAMGGSWAISRPAYAAPSATASGPATSPTAEPPGAKSKSSRKVLSGKLNLNTATEEQLLMLPLVGPAKAERIVAWRKKNGGFKRIADLRHVKGFGYKSFKRLEPFLDIKGDNTLAEK